MGMTREQFKILVKAMKSVYANPAFIPDQDAFDVWHSMLKDLDYAIASRAIQMHMQTEELPPTIAGIRKQASKITGDETRDLNETEAWSLILKAIRRSGYYSEEEFEKLPPILQRSVGSPEQLREWAVLENVDGKTLTVLQSNFQRTFRAEQQKDLEERKLSPDILKLIKKLEDKKTINQVREEKRLTVSEERELANRQSVPMPEYTKEKLNKIFE